MQKGVDANRTCFFSWAGSSVVLSRNSASRIWKQKAASKVSFVSSSQTCSSGLCLWLLHVRRVVLLLMVSDLSPCVALPWL